MPERSEALAADGFLKALSGSVRRVVCRYDGACLVSTMPVDIAPVWNCSMQAIQVDDESLDLSVSFSLLLGEVPSAGVAVMFDFAEWTTDNYVFAPGMVYNGNRFRICPLGYPPYIHDTTMRPLDMPITVTNILHLSNESKPGKIEMKTFNGATPAMGFFSPDRKRGFLMLMEPETELGVSGMIMEEDPERGVMSFVVSAPGVRSSRYAMCGRAASGDQGATFRAGDEITLKLRVYAFPADDIPAYFERFFQVRKALTGPNTYRDVTPFSAAAQILATHHDATKWNEQRGYYYGAGYGQYAYQIGWSGIPVYSHATFVNPSPERLRRGMATLDYLAGAQGKTGLFCAILRDGQRLGDTFGDAEKQPDIAMIRRTGETLYFGLQQLEILHALKQPVKPEWERMLRRAAGALVAVFWKYGQFGQFIDIETGEMQVNGSTQGAFCLAGLVMASQYFKQPAYLALAERAGQLYYERDLSKGYAGGSPGEILQAPDSESALGLCEGYMALYGATGCGEWLSKARMAIHMLASWTVSYDYRFPAGFALERVEAKATGSIFASSQNNHSAPGLYIMSGDFLLRYYRATGDKRVAELYKDMAHNVVQYMNTKHNPIQPGQPDGLTSERVQMSDWEGLGNGNIPPGDSNLAWETLVELSVLQNPGIYLNLDTADLLVLDHIRAEVVSVEKDGIVLELANNTPYDSRIKLFAESASEAKIPFPCTASLRWPQISVKSSETRRIRVPRNGMIMDITPQT